PLAAVRVSAAAEAEHVAVAEDEPVLPLPYALAAVAAEQLLVAVAADEPEPQHVQFAAAVARAVLHAQLAVAVARAVLHVRPVGAAHALRVAVRVGAFAVPVQRVAPHRVSQPYEQVLARRVAAAAASELEPAKSR